MNDCMGFDDDLGDKAGIAAAAELFAHSRRNRCANIVWLGMDRRAAVFVTGYSCPLGVS